VRLANGLYKFKEGSNIDRVVLDCITSLQNGADLLWIETDTPNVKQIAQMVNRVKAVILMLNWFITPHLQLDLKLPQSSV
jgi:isocitrate lyase